MKEGYFGAAENRVVFVPGVIVVVAKMLALYIVVLQLKIIEEFKIYIFKYPTWPEGNDLRSRWRLGHESGFEH